MQRFVRNLFRFCLVCAVLSCAPGAKADSFAASTENGFARLLFGLTPADKVSAQAVGAVLTISFNRKPAITPNAVAQAVPAYLASARADPDGKTFRFALTQSVRVHTSSSAGRFAVDLAPLSYAGTTPNLPPPPPPPGKTVDPTKIETLKVHAGTYRNYTRIVFDWSRNVPYAAFPGAGKLTVRFEALANLDFTAINNQAPPWVKAAGWHIENKGTVVEFVTDAASGFRNFRDGTHVVIDVLAPRTDADAYNPSDNEASTAAAKAQAILDAAAKLNGRTKPAADQPQQAVTEPQPADTAAVAPPAGTPPDVQIADSKLTRDGAVLTFPGAGRRGSAVFIRGLTAWIILQDAPRLDATKLKAQLGDFPAAIDAATTSNSTQLRISLKQPEQIAAFAEGSTLKVVIAPHVDSTALAIGFARNQDRPGSSSISTLLPGVTQPMKLVDPEAGDELTLIPGAAGRKTANERNYVEFSALETASGIVLLPFVDDLSVTIAGTRVTITRAGGLSLTPASLAAGTPEALARSGQGPCFLDFPRWRKISGGTFLATERRLRAAVARLRPQAAGWARLTLAQFYLANSFAAEALGIINILQADDPALQSDMQLQTMRAAANLQMGRYREAHNDLAGAQFDADRHAALWRGLIEAAQENWDPARTDLERAAPVMDAYEPDMRARERLAAAEAALGIGRLEIADAQLAGLSDRLDKPLMLQAALDRARLYAAERRRRDADRLFALVESSGNEQQAAQAVYYRVTAGLAAGTMKPAQAINALERLRYRWRGDQLELKTLRALASIYFAQKSWREGLQTLRIATANFPNDDMSGKAQDDMRAAFVDLFLNGKADGMPPVEALSVFYDFIELTPIGPEGDEMIRHMSDRLVAVDLLGPAADLLQYQIDKRLDGVARAQVATRLAMVQLMDHKPGAVLETLRSTQISTLPDEVAHQRLLMEARALAEQKQWDQALELLAVDQAPDTQRLRADIYWQSSNWPLAAQTAEEALGTRWNEASPLTAEERQTAMRAAVAFSLANDEAGLDRLRTHFGVKMKASPDASAFAVVTQRIDLHGLAFRDAASQVASIDTLKTFMQDLRQQTE